MILSPLLPRVLWIAPVLFMEKMRIFSLSCQSRVPLQKEVFPVPSFCSFWASEGHFSLYLEWWWDGEDNTHRLCHGEQRAVENSDLDLQSIIDGYCGASWFCPAQHPKILTPGRISQRPFHWNIISIRTRLPSSGALEQKLLNHPPLQWVKCLCLPNKTFQCVHLIALLNYSRESCISIFINAKYSLKLVLILWIHQKQTSLQFRYPQILTGYCCLFCNKQ